MDLALDRKAHVFRLPVYLLDKLKQLASKDRRSLNNYVEGLLLEAVNHVPNDETLAAMKEAESGALRDAPEIDMSSVEAMEKSMGL